MLMPKKVKYRKTHKGRRRYDGEASRGTYLSFGEYGLKALETHWITANQIESVRRLVARILKKRGKFWIRIFPAKSVTMKGAEIPMGQGKGAVDHYVAPIKAGTILFEVTGIPEELAREVFLGVAYKLPIKTRFITR